jgi:CubicO group peptidase (beta-lactamase class C family)
MRPTAIGQVTLTLLAGLAVHPAGAQPTRPEPPAARASVWPGREWATATPESQGLSAAALDAAAAYADKHGGGSGCVIRHGYLVKEWGDPKYRADIKSATKGAFGATALGLAVDAGLVKLDDLAQTYYPAIGAERPENSKAWLGAITVRHLATMTGGFDDGRPPKLVYRPGTGSIYSNDTANMLAELLTLRFGRDLRDVVREKVLEPIGTPAGEWLWRDNQYRAKTVGGLPSREFASGVRITHRALARIGLLYLHGGEWDGRRVLPSAYVRTATRPADLPTFVPYYAFYWGSNARGTFAAMPKDAFWALGLGDSILAVCPSLDLVIVRLGTGTRQSQLPGPQDDWGQRVETFFNLVVRDGRGPETGAAEAPYPPSRVITRIDWAPAGTIVRQAKDSDIWATTWADDGHLYTAYGDGTGFVPKVPEKLSLGFARIEGGPERFTGVNIRSATGEQKGDGPRGRKASGMLMVGGVLYMWVRNAGNSQLAWSTDHARTWAWGDWKFTTSFGCPTFLNFGPDYAGARDGYVYVYSHDSDSAYQPGDRVVLARVPKDRLRLREAYEFFTGLDRGGQPRWSNDVNARGAAFTNPGKCYRITVSYDAGLKRYLLCQAGADSKVKAGFGVFDAPEPWGPWTTVCYTPAWDVSPGETCSFPAKWMSADGKALYLVFSGGDCLAVRRATLTTAGDK